MTDSPQADRTRSAETARVQEIRACIGQIVERCIDWTRRDFDFELAERLVLALQTRASSGSPGAAPGADAQLGHAFDEWERSTEFTRTTTRPVDAGDQQALRDAHALLSKALAQPPASAPFGAVAAETRAELLDKLGPIAPVAEELLRRMAAPSVATTGPDAPTADEQRLVEAGWQRHKDNSWLSPDGSFYTTRHAVETLAAPSVATGADEPLPDDV